MTPKDSRSASALAKTLSEFSKNTIALSGLSTPARLASLSRQILSSIRRIEYVRHLNSLKLSAHRSDPASPIFDPLKAAVLEGRAGRHDEAIWLVFLGTHFGKHSQDGWRLTRDIYGAFNTRAPWSWAEISREPDLFRKWARNSLGALLSDGVSRRFSNHRKYESRKPGAIADVLLSYVELVNSYGDHRGWVYAAHRSVGQNASETFDYLYRDMKSVKRFGRLGTFDFLTMVGKLELMPIYPGIAYLDGATGPLRGARLLFDNDPTSTTSPATLENLLRSLDETLNVGKQVLEDSLCNWQKSPDSYVYFRG